MTWIIDFKEDEHVVVVTMNSNSTNRINYKFLKDANECFDTLLKLKNYHSVIIKSQVPNIFCSGLDIKELAMNFTDSKMRKFISELETTFVRLLNFPAKTIACVEGHALAGGFFLMLACDYRIGSDSILHKYGAIEITLGLPLPALCYDVLECKLPNWVSWELSLTGKIFNSTDAFNYKCLNKVVSHEEVFNNCLKESKRLDFNTTGAYISIKKKLSLKMLKNWNANKNSLTDEFINVLFSKSTKKMFMKKVTKLNSKI